MLETKMKTQKEERSDHLSQEASRLEMDRLKTENQQLRIEVASKSSEMKKSSSKVRGSQFANQDNVNKVKRDAAGAIIKCLLNSKSRCQKLKGLHAF